MTDGELIVAALTILAIFLGPILAVWITRKIDNDHASRERRMDIFRTLMRTRKTPIDPEHVAAINLIEIEFANENMVVDAWKKYLSSLGERIADPEDPREQDNLEKKRNTLLTKLIHEIAKSLNFRVEQLDILEGNYYPQGWSDEFREQLKFRRALLGVFQGSTSPHDQPFVLQRSNDPYPPKPEIQKAEQDVNEQI